MLNITLISLISLHNNAFSPLYHIRNFYQLKPITSIYKSVFSYSFTPFIFSQTANHGTFIKNTVFSHSLDSALYFHSESIDDYNGHCFLKKDFKLEPPSEDKFYQIFKNVDLNLSNYDENE